MDIRTLSALLAAIVGLSLGMSMLLRGERQRVVRLYSILALIIGGFYLSHFLHLILGEADRGPRLLRYLSAGSLGATAFLGALVPSTTLGFFMEFLGVSPRSYRTGRQIALLSAVFGLAVGIISILHHSPAAEPDLDWADWARVALAIWVFGSLWASVSLLVRRLGQSDSRIERARLMYLASGAAGSLLFAGLGLGLYSIKGPGRVAESWPVVTMLGPVLITLYLFLLRETLLRLRLMDLQEFLGKVASHTVLAFIMAAVITAGAVLTASGNEAFSQVLFTARSFKTFLFNAVAGSLVILILLDPLRSKVEERLVAIFFRERFALLRGLGRLRTRMANAIDVTYLTTLVLDSLNETGRVTHTSVYLLAEDRPGYRLIDHRGPQPVGFLDAAAARGLLHAASAGQKAVLMENLDRRIAEMHGHVEGKRLRDELKRLNDTRAALVLMKSGLCVPLVGNDRVIGFFNLWDERMPEAYASDEIALILEIAERLATAVENSKLYEKMRERDRLAALGEMAAGLAHEIRNPLGAIKGAAQCLDPRRLPGEEGEFLEVIVEEVNRLNGVVTAFLDYSRPLKQSFGPTDINEVVTRTIRLIQTEIPPHVELKVELAEGLNKVDGDAEQLKQVLINLVQNAIQAMGQRPGAISVRTLKPERFGDFRHSELLEVHVSDTGPGIAPEQQRNIFVPFFTTKEKGTGLGLAICQRIVKNHGGSISVQSRVGEGSTFVIRLPALPVEAPAEAPAAEGGASPEVAHLPSPAPSAPEEPARAGEPAAGQEKPSRREREAARRTGSA